MGIFVQAVRMSAGELGCTYAALILHDDGQEVTEEKMKQLLNAAKVEFEPIGPVCSSALWETRTWMSSLPPPLVAVVPPLVTPVLMLVVILRRRKNLRMMMKRWHQQRTSSEAKMTTTKTMVHKQPQSQCLKLLHSRRCFVPCE